MSGATRDDVYRIVGYIQDDLRNTQAKLVEVRSMLAAGAMNRAPHDLAVCPDCKLELDGNRQLAEHRYTVHRVGKLCLDCGMVDTPTHECPDRTMSALRAVQG